MTYRQKILKAVYPAWMWITRLTGMNSTRIENTTGKKPLVSFYELEAVKNDGSTISFSAFRGKKILIVNTASDCGYTHQYNDLQRLYESYMGKLVVLGFPANDFKDQEKGTDREIAAFCQKNYGVTFPLMQKSSVKKSPAQNPVFRWLTDSSRNGWCNKSPSWNFSKYVINEEGILTHYFDPSVSPQGQEVVKAIQ
jgi:glutathione peroxidase